MSSEIWNVAFPTEVQNTNCNDGENKLYQMAASSDYKDLTADLPFEESKSIYGNKNISSDNFLGEYDRNKHEQTVHSLELDCIVLQNHDDFSCSTPRQVKSSSLSDKYKVSECYNEADDKKTTICKSIKHVLSTDSSHKSYETTSSDLMDRLSLIDIDKTGIDSLLSLPSPVKANEFNKLDISPITERTERSDYSMPLCPHEHNAIVTEYASDKEKKVVERKSKIPVCSKGKFLISSSDSSDNYSASKCQNTSNLEHSKTTVVSTSSDCLPSFSLCSSSPSMSLHYGKGFSNVNAKGIRSNKFAGRLSNSMFSLNDEKVLKCDETKKSNLMKRNSRSVDNLSRKIPDYGFVKSKVKQYIDGIKSAECSRRASPSRSMASTPIQSTSPGAIFLVNDDFINVIENEPKIADDFNSILKQINSNNNNPQVIKNLLKLLINERKDRIENEQTLAALQLEYDNLVAKHATAQNQIDELRLNASHCSDNKVSNIEWLASTAQSCFSTPRNRRHSVALIHEARRGALSELSSSQPNLVKATTFQVTEPSLGISLDDSGSLHFFSTPFSSNKSVPLNYEKNKTQSKPHKHFANEDKINSENNLVSTSTPNAENVQHSSTKKHTHLSNNESLPGITPMYLNLSEKLQDFAKLLASGVLTSDDANNIWKNLGMQFINLCQSCGGQQTTELAALEAGFKLLSRKFSLPLFLPTFTSHQELPPAASVSSDRLVEDNSSYISDGHAHPQHVTLTKIKQPSLNEKSIIGSFSSLTENDMKDDFNISGLESIYFNEPSISMLPDGKTSNFLMNQKITQPIDRGTDEIFNNNRIKCDGDTYDATETFTNQHMYPRSKSEIGNCSRIEKTSYLNNSFEHPNHRNDGLDRYSDIPVYGNTLTHNKNNSIISTQCEHHTADIHANSNKICCVSNPETRPLSSLEKVQKWCASMPSLAGNSKALPSNLETSNGLNNGGKGYSNCLPFNTYSEKNSVSKINAETINSAVFTKRYDRDSGCPISDHSNGHVVKRTSCIHSKSSSSSDESERFKNQQINEVDKSLAYKLLEKYPFPSKEVRLNSQPDHPCGDSYHAKKNLDLQQSLSKLQRDVNILKKSLLRSPDGMSSPKRNSRIHQKRTPIKAMLDYSYTASSDTDSSGLPYRTNPKTRQFKSESFRDGAIGTTGDHYKRVKEGDPFFNTQHSFSCGQQYIQRSQSCSNIPTIDTSLSVIPKTKALHHRRKKKRSASASRNISSHNEHSVCAYPSRLMCNQYSCSGGCRYRSLLQSLDVASCLAQRVCHKSSQILKSLVMKDLKGSQYYLK